MRYGVSSLDRNLAYAKLIDMSSTQKLTTAGIRYRLFTAQKSLRWLAAKLGWDVSKLSRRLAGQPAFKVDELDMICEALGVSFEELLTIPVDMHEKLFGAETPDLEVTA